MESYLTSEEDTPDCRPCVSFAPHLFRSVKSTFWCQKLLSIKTTYFVRYSVYWTCFVERNLESCKCHSVYNNYAVRVQVKKHTSQSCFLHCFTISENIEMWLHTLLHKSLRNDIDICLWTKWKLWKAQRLSLSLFRVVSSFLGSKLRRNH